MINYNKKFGAYGEELASKFLLKRGYTIIQKNFSSKYLSIAFKKSPLILSKPSCVLDSNLKLKTGCVVEALKIPHP